jgi:hypothetical protein
MRGQTHNEEEDDHNRRMCRRKCFVRGAQKEIGRRRDVVLGVGYQVRILGVVVVRLDKMKFDPLGY